MRTLFTVSLLGSAVDALRFDSYFDQILATLSSPSTYSNPAYGTTQQTYGNHGYDSFQQAYGTPHELTPVNTDAFYDEPHHYEEPAHHGYEEPAQHQTYPPANHQTYPPAAPVAVPTAPFDYWDGQPTFGIHIIADGHGPKVEKNQKVTAHYTGTLLNGVKFDSSRDRYSPFEFTVGQGKVIKCWDIGFEELKKGTRAILNCPASTAYGTYGQGSIPGNATLQFDVEVLDIENGFDYNTYAEPVHHTPPPTYHEEPAYHHPEPVYEEPHYEEPVHHYEAPMAKEGETCRGYNVYSNKAFPECETGLTCVLQAGAPDPATGRICVNLYEEVVYEEAKAQELEICEGFNEATGQPYPMCVDGLTCALVAGDTIPGAANRCFDFSGINTETHHSEPVVVLAQELELCEGHDENGHPYPDCEHHLTCALVAGDQIPGQANRCFDFGGVPIETHSTQVFAGLGETCEGFNVASNEPYPFCLAGLECGLKHGRPTMDGASNACFDPHHMMDNGSAPHFSINGVTYPHLGIDFFAEEPVFIHPEPSYAHIDSIPSECNHCDHYDDRIDELESEIRALKSANRYSAPRRSTYRPRTYSTPTYNKYQPKYDLVNPLY